MSVLSSAAQLKSKGGFAPNWYSPLCYLSVLLQDNRTYCVHLCLWSGFRLWGQRIVFSHSPTALVVYKLIRLGFLLPWPAALFGFCKWYISSCLWDVCLCRNPIRSFFSQFWVDSEVVDEDVVMPASSFSCHFLIVGLYSQLHNALAADFLQCPCHFREWSTEEASETLMQLTPWLSVQRCLYNVSWSMLYKKRPTSKFLRPSHYHNWSHATKVLADLLQLTRC